MDYRRRADWARAALEAEVDRYIDLPGQAFAYQVGNLKFCELRARAEKSLADRFDIRGFYDALISLGSVGLGVFEDAIDA